MSEASLEPPLVPHSPAQRIAAVLEKRLPSATLQIVPVANHLLPATHHRMLSELLLTKLED